MKTPFHKASMLAAVVVTALAFAPSMAQAQTINVPAQVTVQNTLTLTVVDPMDFGTVAAISDGAQTANLAIDAATGVLSTTSSGPPATFAVIDSSTATRAQVTVEDAAPGANLNFEIDNVVNPIFGGAAFDLTDFETSWNGGAVTARLVATPFVYPFSDIYNGGVNELNIGASVETRTTVPVYADGTYLGSFDVIASY